MRREKETRSPYGKLLPRDKDFEEFLSNRLAHGAVNFFWEILTLAYILAHINSDKARDMLRIYFDKEANTGALEDAIMGDTLYVPNVDKTSLIRKDAVAGRLHGYDFNRERVFGKRRHKRPIPPSGGRLALVAFPEIEGNPEHLRTPLGLTNFLDFNTIINLECPSLSDAVKRGYLRETTHREAYTKVGLYEKYRKFMGLAGIDDLPVYAITPKGNGLVGLLSDGGQSRKEPEASKQLAPSLHPI